VLAAILVPLVTAQSPNTDVTNEYRLTLVTSKPMTDKLIMFGYLGLVKAPDKGVGTLYYSPPGVIYKPRPWMELWAGMFGLYNNNETTSNSWELRPLGGIKFFVPNDKKINLYNFTRFEERLVNQDHNWKDIPRLRNRVGIEVPFTRAKAWTTKSFYGLADIEPIWRFDNPSLQLIRVRGGVGYIFSKTWRAEFIYHAEFTGDPKDYTGNIWRLNIKLNLPRHGQRPEPPPDIDE
jgi:hypothetical protein